MNYITIIKKSYVKIEFNIALFYYEVNSNYLSEFK